MYIRDTIAAISTPTGNGGIGIIRVSGDQSEYIANTIFKRAGNGGFMSHRFYFGKIVNSETEEIIDEALVVLMRAPNSYTKEDILELHCHGGMFVVEKVLALVLASGARLANPGEFTRRAFLNGRIDLVQAEAVIDIISSQTDAALDLAQKQREGVLSGRIYEVNKLVLKALVLVEAYIDFPEDDLGEADIQTIVSLVKDASFIVGKLLSGFEEGRILRDGISTLILGKPNVGKSSLLNCLLNENRAIVTHIPGTTRDTIEETINLGGLAVKLLDTAGIRSTNDIIEKEGINRALDKIIMADIVLFVLDASRPFDDEDISIMDELKNSRVIIVINKVDLNQTLQLPKSLANINAVTISARTGDGIETLKTIIRDIFLKNVPIDSRDYIVISKARHRDALISAQKFLNSVINNTSSTHVLELIAVDLRDALSALGSVVGETTSEEVLNNIFSTFCIGK